MRQAEMITFSLFLSALSSIDARQSTASSFPSILHRTENRKALLNRRAFYHNIRYLFACVIG
jgi:hypothetical protein